VTTVQVVSLLLGLSLALNVGYTAGCLASRTGLDLPRAILVGGGAAGTALAIFLAGVSAYR
jgi:hypothetical protein